MSQNQVVPDKQSDGRPISTPKFEMASRDDRSGPMKIKGIVDVNCYLVNFNDAEGKNLTSLVFDVPDSESSFILNQQIQGKWIATSCVPWFNTAFKEELERRAATEGEIGSV